MRRRLVLALFATGAMLVAGCASPQPGDDAPLVSIGDVATYDLVASARAGSPAALVLTATVGDLHEWNAPDGRHFSTLPLSMRASNASRSFDFTVEVSRSGEVASIGTLSGAAPGYQQFSARTRAWHGHPGGPITIEKCGALLVEAAFASASSSAPVGLGDLASWSRDAGIVRDEDGSVLGNLTVEGRAPWPTRAAWRSDAGSCEFAARGLVPGMRPATMMPGPSPDVLQDRSVLLAGRAPPTGDLPIPISLEKADASVAQDVVGGRYLAAHPDAWVVQAEYRPAADATTAAKWVLLYGEANATHFFVVEATPPPLPFIVRDGGERAAYVPPRESVPRVTPLDRVGAVGAIPKGDIVLISWSTAKTPSEIGTEDAALWQVRVRSGAGFVNDLYGASSGRALSRVSAPFEPPV